MRIKDLLSEEFMTELSFMGSQCTKDCSGHRAGYKWSLDRGGVENPASHSQSFINGSNIGVRQIQNNKQTRTQGGGKIAGYQSQSAQAVAKRQARAQAKVNQGVQGTPQNEHIVKVGSEYELKSKSTGKNLGKYSSKAGAEKRERQVQYFKNR
jgi:hypothetical protein